jgi:hypothetical protein
MIGRPLSQNQKCHTEVFHGTAKHTSGGLHKKNLVKTKRGRKAIKNLRKLGYIAKKGKFSLFTKKSKRGGFSDSFADMEKKPVV